MKHELLARDTATCTLAIVNFNTLARVDIPGLLPHGEAARDTATFGEIYEVARAMEVQCVEQGQSPENVGWAVVGECFASIALAYVGHYGD